MGEKDGSAPNGAAFTQTLAALKRRGSNLLVVGSSPGDGHGAACTRLLGQTDVAPRRRVFVFTDGGDAAARLPEEDGADDRTSVISRATPTRSAAARPASGALDTSPFDADPEPLSQLVSDAIDAVDEFAAADDGLDPGELRICVDSVLPVLDECTEETAFRLLHRLTDRIERERGMGHFHLPLARTDRQVELLRPLFDAVIEVRTRSGRAEHRWNLRDRELTSDWLPL